MNILIIEDIKEICNFMSNVITNHYSDATCDCSYNYDDALLKAINSTYDAFIIDYELDKDNPSKNGIELGKQILTLEKYKNTPILIESSYPEYVFDAVNSLNCLYYLLKPYKEEDIIKMADKLFLNFAPDLKLVFHTTNSIKVVLSVSDIICIKSSHHCITVVTHNSSYLFVNYSLSQLEEDSKGNLVRCHKSYIVNPKYIKYVDKVNKYVTLVWGATKETIPIGRKYANQIYDRYGNNK
ncbi:MAG: response regulator transcription factor [Lachnospiraceae bacterium]|nr:response regulator transcription factor [Lachnospiraceae bacterium]